MILKSRWHPAELEVFGEHSLPACIFPAVSQMKHYGRRLLKDEKP